MSKPRLAVESEPVAGLHLRLTLDEKDLAALCKLYGADSVRLSDLLIEAAHGLMRQSAASRQEDKDVLLHPNMTFNLTYDIKAE